MDVYHNVFDEIVAALNRHDVRELAAHLADDAIFENVADPSPYDRIGACGFYASLFAAFPDMRYDVLTRFDSRSQVAAEVLLRGTHLGRFRQLEATGRAVKFAGAFLMEFRGPRVVKWRWYFDAATLLYELGVLGAGGLKLRQPEAETMDGE
jgi:steroid delta-isomerase-like uncharacterized protein